MAKWKAAWLVALGLGALLGISSGCAAPAQQQPSQVAQAEHELDDDEELVCRREHRTGTNISKRVCYTRAQRDRHAADRREQDQQTLRDGARWGCEGEACTGD
jgi:hypothetical protein